MYFLKKIESSVISGPEILAFGGHSSMNIQLILVSFIPILKIKYEDSENIKTEGINTVVFNLDQIKQRNFLGTHGIFCQVHDTDHIL